MKKKKRKNYAGNENVKRDETAIHKKEKKHIKRKRQVMEELKHVKLQNMERCINERTRIKEETLGKEGIETDETTKYEKVH